MKTQIKKADGFRRSACAVANSLDLVGDKWSLLVIRDMFHGKRTYGELLNSPEGIPTNILADRLKRLADAGIIAGVAYQDHPPRYSYTLTAKGRDLGDVLLAFVRWGKRHVPGSKTLNKSAPGVARRQESARAIRTRAKVTPAK